MDNERTINVSLRKQMIEDLERRADSLHLTVSEYVMLILKRRFAAGQKLELQEP